MGSENQESKPIGFYYHKCLQNKKLSNKRKITYILSFFLEWGD